MGSGLTKIGNLTTVNILFFEKGRSRKVTLTSHHPPITFFSEEEEKYVKDSLPVPEQKTTFYQRWGNLHKQTLLNSPLTS